MGPGPNALCNSASTTPGEVGEGVQPCALPIKDLTGGSRNKLLQNTVALGAMMHLIGIGFQSLEDTLKEQFGRKGQGVVDENITVATADHVGLITVNRPDKLNALNNDTIAELIQAFSAMGLDDDVAAVVLTGSAGKAFIAGADSAMLS